ncbi:YbaN family protein [Candidatus Viridilinea mediisalina]|uniref:DUF454 domain-containing protein n=1 Tax=Candidatus Viridilinea mediisalina TaxID=2024553 RepID=A0A2A6RFE3_9CHLR|nr:YbaN family protein [Candidatus Viridilinea mediisalina]PDW01598.1 hypothetical protein CJ255_18355 [Candidatus Viridilinea mediisalina]
MSHGEVPIDTPETAQPHRSRIVRWLLIGAGSFALALGGLGVIIPGLPTTPFVLLAAACYIRSSERLYRWLLGSRVFGPIITTWQTHRGMTRQTKLATLILVWLSIGGSALFLVANPLIQAIMLGVAMIKTVILVRIRTVGSI